MMMMMIISFTLFWLPSVHIHAHNSSAWPVPFMLPYLSNVVTSQRLTRSSHPFTSGPRVSLCSPGCPHVPLDVFPVSTLRPHIFWPWNIYPVMHVFSLKGNSFFTGSFKKGFTAQLEAGGMTLTKVFVKTILYPTSNVWRNKKTQPIYIFHEG